MTERDPSGEAGRGAPSGQRPAGLPEPSRRAVLRTGALGGVLASLAAAGCGAPGAGRPGASPPQQAEPVLAGSDITANYVFNQGWLFGGRYTAGSQAPGYDDSAFAPVTLPHTVTPLSWRNWDPRAWEDVWIYRKHFRMGRVAGRRVFADFDGVMVNAKVFLNGVQVSAHQGGYLPWSAELTRHLSAAGNVLAVVVDARWLNVPPAGGPGGPRSIDYLQPGGIYRDVTLRTVPATYLADLFARPAGVLGPGRRVEVQATIDAAVLPPGPARVTAELRDGSRTLARASAPVTLTRTGRTTARLTLRDLGDVTLWSPRTPRLYTVATTVTAGAQSHTTTVRTGLREAVFRTDGFYLNGERLKIFGLNRHQLFPYTGMAGAARLQRRDAEILKTELNCNMVRCSHYPQSPHFLDACDELGIMVWQETPGWHFIGDRSWQDLLLQNVSDMVIRDRSRPSVIVWGTRANETRNDRRLYAKARALAHRLDGSRQTSGAMASYSTSGWAEDVFAYDDYHSRHGNAELRPPLPRVPYLVTESVGALDGSPTYRWTDSAAVLAEQARMHAQVHAIAGSSRRYAGLLGWAGIDYASLAGGDRIWDGLKTPGVIDIFRVPKPAAAVYRSQVSPHVRPVILPVFPWDSAHGSPPDGPGRDAMIATNCERLEIYLGGAHVATGRPDTGSFGHLAHPPVLVHLLAPAKDRPDLRIDGYLGSRKVATARMSADRSRDRLSLALGDSEIQADGSDTTRLTFRATDAYGNHRRHVTGVVRLELTGPATLIGENPFPFGYYGGVGGAFLRSQPGRSGQVTVTARHETLGRASVTLTVTPPGPATQYL